jgi:phage-related protein
MELVVHFLALFEFSADSCPHVQSFLMVVVHFLFGFDDSIIQFASNVEQFFVELPKTYLQFCAKTRFDIRNLLIDTIKALIDLIKPLLDLIKALLDLAKALLDLAKALVDFAKALVDLAKALVNLAKALVNPVKVLVNPVKVLVNSIKSLINRFFLGPYRAPEDAD